MPQELTKSWLKMKPQSNLEKTSTLGCNWSISHRMNRSLQSFVLTIKNATKYCVIPILALAVLRTHVPVRPIQHNLWAIFNKKTRSWQTLSIKACLPRDALNSVCKNAVLEREDRCWHAEGSTCIFEMSPVTHAQSQECCVGRGCACVRSSCTTITIESFNETTNGTNFSICNFTTKSGCDFSCTTQELLLGFCRMHMMCITRRPNSKLDGTLTF